MPWIWVYQIFCCSRALQTLFAISISKKNWLSASRSWRKNSCRAIIGNKGIWWMRWRLVALKPDGTEARTYIVIPWHLVRSQKSTIDHYSMTFPKSPAQHSYILHSIIASQDILEWGRGGNISTLKRIGKLHFILTLNLPWHSQQITSNWHILRVKRSCQGAAAQRDSLQELYLSTFKGAPYVCRELLTLEIWKTGVRLYSICWRGGKTQIWPSSNSKCVQYFIFCQYSKCGQYLLFCQYFGWEYPVWKRPFNIHISPQRYHLRDKVKILKQWNSFF